MTSSMMPEIFVWIAVLFWEDLVAGWGSPCSKSLCGEPHAVADPFHSNCVAIVVVVHSTLEDWAKKSGIKYSTFAEFCERPESNKEVLSSLSQVSISTSCESSYQLIPVWNCLVNCVPWFCLYLYQLQQCTYTISLRESWPQSINAGGKRSGWNISLSQNHFIYYVECYVDQWKEMSLVCLSVHTVDPTCVVILVKNFALHEDDIFVF